VQLIAVCWRDAFSSHDEIDIGDWQADMLVETVGFLVSEEGGYLHVAQEIVHVAGGDRLRCVTHIPADAVIWRLPVDRPRKVDLHEVTHSQGHPAAG
jgi:hypothetical protein